MGTTHLETGQSGFSEKQTRQHQNFRFPCLSMSWRLTVINGHYFKVIPSPATSSLKANDEQEAHSPARSDAAYRRRFEVSSNRLH